MSRKIFLNGRFLTQALTGVQRTAYEIVKALDDLIGEKKSDLEDFEFILIYSGQIRELISLKNIKLINKGVLKGNLWEQFELPVYTFGSLLLSMCTISTLFKRKQMVIVHDASFLVNPGFFSKAFRTWYRFAIPLLGKIARHIITVSEFSKQELIKHAHFSKEKISVIYNSPEHLRNVGEPNQEFKNKIDLLKPFCLSVSSLAENKNFNGLNKALERTNFKNYRMLIAGGISATLNKSTSQSGNFINYLGYVTDEQLKLLYSKAALFIFPSFYEGFGLPPLEAMISGCPVIASNTSSIPEVLGNAAEYFDPYSVDDMAEKIQSLLNNETRMVELKRLGFEQASKYSWQRASIQVLELLKHYSR